MKATEPEYCTLYQQQFWRRKSTSEINKEMSAIIIFYKCSFLSHQEPKPPSFYNNTKISVLMFCIMIHRSTIQHLPNTGWRLFDLQLPSASIVLSCAWTVNALAGTATDSNPERYLYRLLVFTTMRMGWQHQNPHKDTNVVCSSAQASLQISTWQLYKIWKSLWQSLWQSSIMLRTAWCILLILFPGTGKCLLPFINMK